MDIHQVGIIGVGQMGSGIAQSCAASRLEVRLYDAALERAEAGLAVIGHNLMRQLSKEKISKHDHKATLERISIAEDYGGLAECDLVIEAVVENEAVKSAVFDELCPHLPEKTLIATNTSSLSITRLAATTDRPERFIGIHFMNPVPVMTLVELIRGIATSEETFACAKQFVTGLGKTIAMAEDFPGFIVNRILLPMINEAIYTIYEGVGTIEAVDTAMKLGTRHPMGPLELADFIGLDTCLSIMQVLYDGLSDSKYRPCPLLVKYVEADWLGRKTKRGFYDYNHDPPVPTR